jgi:DNA-directed RNA polymerase specialized sigma24 family protein
VSGMIGNKAMTEGHGGVALPWELRGSSREAAETRKELAGETAAAALVLFRQKLIDGEWNPAGGRSLTSYFMGACLYAFPNVLRRWKRCEDRWKNAQVRMRSEIVSRETTVHPDRDVDAMILLDTLLSSSDNREATIVRLSADRFTSAEIAHVLGSTPGAVRAVLKRWRTKAQLRLADDQGADDESKC